MHIRIWFLASNGTDDFNHDLSATISDDWPDPFEAGVAVATRWCGDNDSFLKEVEFVHKYTDEGTYIGTVRGPAIPILTEVEFLSGRGNFYGKTLDGTMKPFMVRCPRCQKENYLPAVASGVCNWCGAAAPQKGSEP